MRAHQNFYPAIAFFVAILFFTGTAGALDFNFSFDDTDGGGTAGPITGTITGLSDDTAGQQATSFILTGVGAHSLAESAAPPVDILSSGTWLAPTAHQFTVSGGAITMANFLVFTSPSGAENLSLHFGDTLKSIFTSDGPSGPLSTTRSTVDGVTFTPVTSSPVIPEPNALSLVLLGLAGLVGCSGRRRLRDHVRR